MSTSDLNGLTIVVTRPRAQAQVSATWLESLGVQVIVFPVLEIEALPDAVVDANFKPSDLQSAEAIIFVSANAAEFGVAAIQTRGGFPRGAAIFAIGGATTAKLAEAGVADVQSPLIGNDSEALLSLPALQSVAGKHILIVRGISDGGGRAHLQEILSARGARVSMLECYARRSITASAASQSHIKAELAAGKIHAFSVLSVETLESLVANLTLQLISKALSECMMLVPHRRVADAALKMGFTNVSVVPMGGEALYVALLKLKPSLLNYANKHANSQMNPK